MNGRDWIVDWWKVLALALFVAAMAGVYWVVHGLAVMFPTVFMWFGGIGLAAVATILIWDRFVRRRGPPTRSRERER